MTTTVELPSEIEKAIKEKIERGEYTSKSDFIKEAVRTHLDKVLLTPQDIKERAEELRKGEAETKNWNEVKDDI